jgi:Transcription factor Iwr1
MGDAPDNEEEDEFVYDVFVRQQDDKGLAAVELDAAVGTLRIPEGAEEEWGGEELWVGGEEDEKVETDDEDSNAEDYYGADYPEDEDDDEEDDSEEEDERYGSKYGRDEEYVADYDDQFKAMRYM